MPYCCFLDIFSAVDPFFLPDICKFLRSEALMYKGRWCRFCWSLQWPFWLRVMNSDLALNLMTNLFWTGLLICLPILGLTMLVGLMISIFQVVTQIQEMSLTFVPKLITAAVTLVVAGPWMLRTLTQYTIKLWSNIPALF